MKRKKQLKFKWFWQKEEKKNNLSKTLSRNINKNNGYLFIFLLIILVISFLEINIMFNLRKIIDEGIKSNSSEVLKISKKIFVFMLLTIPLSIFSSFLAAFYISNSTMNLKNFYFNNQLSDETLIYKNDSSSKASSILVNDVGLIEKMFYSGKLSLLSALINLFAGVILMIIIDWRIILFSLLIVGFLFFGISIFSSIMLNKIEDLSKSYEKYTNYLKNITNGMYTIKINKLERKVQEDFFNNASNLERDDHKIKKIQVFINTFIQVIISVFLFVIFIIILNLIKKEYYTVAQILFFLSAFTLIIAPSIALFSNVPNINAGREKIIKINNSFFDKNVDNGLKEFMKIAEEIELKNVSFSYEDKNIFNNLNLKFELDKKYLIVGDSGTGKTTLLNLLLRKYVPSSGDIKIDGVNINEFKIKSYLKKISYIDQNVFLFDESILNNITLFKKYDSKKINAILTEVNLKNFKDKLDFMIVNNGKNISSGEKVRLAIARGLINDSNIILLDEPFANLDKKNIIEIEKNIIGLKNKLILNVSHMINEENLKLYDHVILFEEDEIKVKNIEEYEKIFLNK